MTTKGPSSDTLQLRRGTATEWTTADPVLSAGEVGWERDTNKVKIGDGATAWTSLPYLAGTGVGVDHGVLSGLGDDDHPQYAALAQDEAVTGSWTFDDADVLLDAANLYIRNDELDFEEPSSTDRVLTTYVTGQSNFQFVVDAAGKLLWGSGGGAGDTNLYRSAANTLKTDDSLIVAGDLTAGFTTVDYLEIVEPGATDFAFDTYVVGDTQVRFIMDASGKMAWGPGNTASDTNLYRSAANVLATTGDFVVLGADNGIYIDHSNPGLTIGGDVNLHRQAANILGTDDGIEAGGTIQGKGGPPGSMGMGETAFLADAEVGHSGGYWDPFMWVWDTGLTEHVGAIRQSNSSTYIGTFTSGGILILMSDAGEQNAVLTPAGQFQVPTTGSAGGLLLGGDTNLYRSAADVLQTDDDFYAGSTAGAYTWLSQSNGVLHYYQAEANPRFWISRDLPTAGGGASGVAFGPGGAVFPDTNLYRSAADVLKTDDSLTVSGNLLLPSGGSSQLGITNGGAIGANGLQLYYDGTNAIVGTIGVLPLRFRTDGVERMRLATATDALDFGATLKLQWGTAIGTNDTNLYRGAADRLSTDDSFYAGLYLKAFQGADQEVLIGSVVAGASGILFGSAQDRALYRKAWDVGGYDVMTFDKDVWVDGNYGLVAGNHYYLVTQANSTTMQVGSAGGWDTGINFATPYEADTKMRVHGDDNLLEFKHTVQLGWSNGAVGATVDTNLYRSAANTLKTDDNLESLSLVMTGDLKTASDVYARFGVGGDTRMGAFGPGSEAGFLIGGDTNLYRGAADVLKTDDGFIVAGVAGFTATMGPVALGTTTANDVRTPFVQSPDTTAAYLDLQNATNSVLVQNRTDATYVPLRTRGMAAQSGYLQSWENSTPATLAAITATGALDMVEQAAPAAPAADTGRVFFQDDGSGKTQAAIRFPSGASQIIATEP